MVRPRLTTPAPPPNMESKKSQQPQELTWNPTPWQKTPPSVAKHTDPVQLIASETVIPSTEETQSDDIVLSKSERATPPIPMKHDRDDDTNITTDANLPSFVVVSQQSSDDPELSLKLVRIELENERHKRELKDKERQIKDYEEEIILLRTQKSYRNEFEACLSEKEQLKKNYDADMERFMVIMKKQHKIESTLRSELKELQDTVTKIEANKRLELEELRNELKKKHNEIGKKLDEQEKIVVEHKKKIEVLQDTNKKLTEYGINKESEVQDTRDQLQKVKDKLDKDMEEKDEVIASLQQAVEVRSETVSQMKQALDQQIMRANEQLEAKQKQIDQLAEKLQLEEAQSAIYKQDFETERNDRQKLHHSFTDLQGHCKYLKLRLIEEEKFTTAQGKYHELQQQNAADKEQIDVTRQLAEASEDINHERQRVEKLEQQIHKNQKELERIKKEKVAEVSELEERVRQYKKKLEKQELATDAAQSEVEFLKKEEDRLKKENKELKKESKKTAIQSTQRIEKQEKEFMETERREIKALTRDIEHSRAELKKQEDDFKSQLKEKENEILRVSNQCNEHKAKFEACSSEIERLQKYYDADMEKLKVAIKKQYNIESTLRSELKELQNTITKIETDKRLKLEELKKKHDEIGKKLDGQEKVVDKQKQDIETLQVTNKNLTEYGINKESEVQDTRDQLQKVKDKLAKNMEEKDEVIASLQQAVEVRSETVSQMKQALDQQMMRANEQLEAKQKQIDELVEKLQVEQAQSAIYKHDFETERNDQQKLHQSFIDLQAHCEYLKQKLTEEEKFINAQGKYHELQKHEHYKLIAPMTDEVEKTKGELMKAKEQLSSLTKEKKRLEKRIKELEQGETERVIEIEQEMQALTAQVNAYSREVDKQKGLVTQSQEKHKTEVIQLQEKLKREMKSKDNELARMKQQLTNVSADKEELLRAYHEEQARLEGQIERMRKANKVLMEKVNAYKSGTTPVIDTPRLSSSVRKPQHPLPPSIAERPGFTIAPVVQSDGDGMLVVSKTEGITPAHHTDSDSVPDDSPAFISKEEMARMFKSYNQQGSSDWSQSPQQVEDSSLAAQKVQPTEESLVAEQKRQELARKADDALLEVDRMRRQADLKQKPVHQQTNNDSDTQDESRPKGQLTKEIEEMADEVRKASRGPNTDEVIFNDDPNDDRPYDPNLVCPRCGKQYRVGEIQKLRRHINEFCTGIR